MAEKKLELYECMLTKEEIFEAHHQDVEFYYSEDYTILQAQLNKIREAGYKSLEEVQQQIAKAKQEGRKEVVEWITPLFDFYECKTSDDCPIYSKLKAQLKAWGIK